MRLPTASELPRVAACPASASLPQQRLPESTDASLGTAVHLYMSHGIVPDDADALAVGEQAAGALPAGAWRWEVTLAMDSASGEARELGECLARDYSTAQPTELVGTADAISIQGTVARILEIKTGWRPVSADGWQTRWLALAAARAHHCDSAQVLLLVAHPDGARLETMTYDAFALDAIEQELGAMIASLSTATQPQPGDWCRYCPAMASCPAATGIVRALAQVDGAMELTSESVASTYRTLKAARAALTRLEGQLETWALQQPVPLGEGRFWGLRTSEQWEFSEQAPASLRAMLGSVAAKAISQKISASSLAKALGKEKAKAVMAQLAATGQASKRQVARLTEYADRSEGT